MVSMEMRHMQRILDDVVIKGHMLNSNNTWGDEIEVILDLVVENEIMMNKNSYRIAVTQISIISYFPVCFVKK